MALFTMTMKVQVEAADVEEAYTKTNTKLGNATQDIEITSCDLIEE